MQLRIKHLGKIGCFLEHRFGHPTFQGKRRLSAKQSQLTNFTLCSK